MALQKAGGTNVYNSWTPADGPAIVDKLETDLVTAGWSIISGAGTDAITFESAANNQGEKIRIVTSVTTTPSRCRIKLSNVAGTLVTANYGMILAPSGSETWKLLANKFGFCIFAVGGAGSARKFGICINAYVPSLLAATVTQCAWMAGDAAGDTTTKRDAPARNVSHIFENEPMWAVLYNFALIEEYTGNGTDVPGIPGFPAMMGPTRTGVDQTLDFASGDLFVTEALLMFGSPARTNQARIRGQLYDCVAVQGTFNETDEITFGADVFVAITHANPGEPTTPPRPRWTLFWLKP